MINNMRSTVAWICTRSECTCASSIMRGTSGCIVTCAKPSDFLHAIQSFREDLVVGAECMFTWYWLADLCRDENIEFILGHALYMKAIHGGKKKNDKLDSEKIARIMRGGTFPMSYVYPRDVRDARLGATSHVPCASP